MRCRAVNSVLIVCLLFGAMFVGMIGFDNDLVGEVEAVDRYVGPGQTYANIQDAIDAALNGDTIYIYNGTYNENVIINQSVTLIGNGTENTIINGMGGYGINITVSNVTVQNLTIDNCTYTPPLNGIGIYINNDTKILQNVNLSNIRVNNSGVGIAFDNATFCNVDNCTIENSSIIGILFGLKELPSVPGDSHCYNCIVSNCSINQSLSIQSGTGIYLSNCTNFTISHNTIYNMTCNQSQSGPDAYGIQIIGANNTNVNDNTIFDCDNGGIALVGSNYTTISQNNIFNSTGNASESSLGIKIFGSNNNTIFNNSVYGHKYGIYLSTSSSVGNLPSDNNIIYHNNFYNNSVGNAHDEFNNTWNLTYGSSGNYWGDYSGVDVKSGPAQDQPGMDGYGDVARVIAGGGVSNDNYPLMHEFVWSEQVGPTIDLLTPFNNSVIMIGTFLAFDIWDGNYDLSTFNYTANLAVNQSFAINYTNDTSNEAEGQFIIEVHAKDSMGQITIEWFNFTLDSTPPNITLVSPANDTFIIPGTEIDLEINDTNLDKANYSLDGNAPTVLNAPWNISTVGWSQGPHYIMVNATDLASLKTTKIFNFTVDTLKPEIKLESPQNNSLFMAGTIINFTITDPNLDMANYSRNGEVNVSLNETNKYDIDTTGWPDGNYQINVHAIDLRGNLNITTFNFSIDSNPPIITLVSPANNSFIKPGTNITLTIIDPNLYNINYSKDGGANQTFIDPYNISTTGWLDGAHYITVNANDTVDNNISKIFNFTIDSILPEIILNTPADNSVITTGTIINLTINDTNIEIVNYTVNSVGNTTITDPYDIDTTGWPDGIKVIDIFATDKAGNFNNTKYTFTLDSVGPVITLVSLTNNSVIAPGTNISLDIVDENLDKVNYSINGNAPVVLSAPYNITTNTSSWAEGNNTIVINATDKVGHLTTEIYNFTIDSIAPVIILNSPANNEYFKAGIIIDLDITEANIDIVNYTINDDTNITLGEPYDIYTPGLNWPDDTYIINVYATDLANHTTTQTYTFYIDSTKPVITINSPANNSVVRNGTTIDLKLVEANIDTVNYSIESRATQTLAPPYNISTSTWADGNYIIKVHAKDLAGNTALLTWFNFTIDSTKPVITLLSPADNEIIKAGVEIDLSVTEVNLEVVNYSIDGGEAKNLTAPYSISTTGWVDGKYSITVSALDKAENKDNIIITITIDSTKPSIDITAPTTTLFFAGTIIDLNITDANLDTVNFSLDDGLAQNLTTPFDINTTGWTVGNYNLKVTAKDKAGNIKIEIFGISILPIIVDELVVQSTTPDPGAVNVSFDIEIVIEFNLTVNTSAVEEAITISPAATIENSSWDQNNKTITIKFTAALKGGTKYTITVDTGAESATGIALINAYSWSFTTEMDTDNDNIPDDVDTDDDGDGIPDTWEIDHDLNSLDSEDATADPDNDDLTNLQEYLNDTDPQDDDSDDDGLTDGAEVKTHETDPNDNDSDNDNILDGVEIEKGTDPNDPTSKPSEKEKDKEEDLNMTLIAGIIVVIIVIILILLFLMMRKKPKEEEEVEEEEKEAEEPGMIEKEVAPGMVEKEVVEGEEPGIAEDEEQFECPDCGAVLASSATVCPDCGAEFEDEEEEEEEATAPAETAAAAEEPGIAEDEEQFECPDCGAVLASSATVCPDCGAEFEEEEE